MFKQMISIVAVSALLISCGTDVDDPEYTPSEDSIKIGMILPTTGALASFGLTGKNSAQLAIKEINDAGGVNGKQLELLIKDSQLDGPTGAAAAQSLSEQGAIAIIGAAASSVTLYTSQNQTIADGMPLISPSSTSPLISTLDDNNTVWRTIASDAFQGVILANLLVDDGINTVAGFYRNDAYGGGLWAAFVETFESLGGTVLADVPYPDTKEIDFGNEVTQLFANGSPDAIVAITFFTDGANFSRDLVSAGHSDVQLYGVDGNFGAALLANGAPQVLEGMKGTAPVPPASTQNYQTFFNNFNTTFGFAPDVFGESSYDAVYLVALALAQSGGSTKADVIANLQSVSRADGDNAIVINPGEFDTALSMIASGSDVDYNGASGAIDFDNNGDVTSGTYIIWEVVNDNGTLVYQELEVISIP